MGNSSILKHTTIYAIGDIIPKIVNFIFFPILTRYLSPADYGIINYVNSFNAFVLILSVLCLNTYYMVYFNKVQTEDERKKLLGSLSLFVVILNVVVTLVLLVCGNLWFDKISENIPFYPYMVIGLFINLFNSIAVMPLATLRMEENVKTYTILSVSKAILITVCTFLSVVFIAPNATSALLSQMIVIMVYAVLFIVFTSKNAIITLNKYYIKEGLKFSLPLVPGSLAYYAVTMSDRIFINKYLSLFDLGIYSTASTLALILVTISTGAYRAFEPYVFKLPDNSSKEDAIKKLFKNYFLAVLFFALGISLFAKEFLVFFADEKYHIAYKYVPLILIGTIFTSLSLLFSTVIISNGQTIINSLVSIIGGAISVSLNILFLRYGVIFACITSMVSLGVMFILNVYYSRIKLNWFPYICIFFISYSMQICFYITDLNIWWELLIKTCYIALVAYIFYSRMDIKIKRTKELH